MDMFDSRSASLMYTGGECLPFDDAGWLFEIHSGGERCLAYLDDKRTFLESPRFSGLLSRFPELSTLNQSVRCRCILDGEVVITDEKGQPDPVEVNRRVSGNVPSIPHRGVCPRPAVFVASDMLYQSGYSLTDLPLSERKAALDNLVTESAQFSIVRYVTAHGTAFYQRICRQHRGSVTAKRLDSLYFPGRRTEDWLDMKASLEDDYLICGYETGNDGTVHLILGQYSSKHELVYQGEVELPAASNDFAALASVPVLPGSPFRTLPPAYAGKAVWISPEKTCRVTFVARNYRGLMRKPVYRGLKTADSPRQSRNTRQ